MSPPAEIAAEIQRIVAEPLAGPELTALGLSAEERAEFAAFVVATRTKLAMHLLLLRAMSDNAALAVLRALLPASVETIETGIHPFLEEMETQLRVTAHAMARERDNEFIDTIYRLIGAPAFFRQVKKHLDGALGVVETATAENFDERAYLAANPDIADAVARGEARSGRAHFLAHGAKEGRAQRNSAPGLDGSPEELIYPLRFSRDDASNAAIGVRLPGARVDLPTLLSRRPEPPYAIAVLSEAEEHDATPSLAVEQSIGADSLKVAALQEKLAWRAPPIYLAAFPDACADLESGLVTFDRDKAWGDSSWATILAPGTAGRTPDVFSLAGRHAKWRREGDEQARRVSVPEMLFTSWASRGNYGHWLMNSIFSAWLVLDELKAGRLNLLTPPLTARQRDELHAIGAPAQSIVETGARHVRSDWLIYPSPVATFANMEPSSVSLDFFDHLKRSFESQEGAAPEYVFLSRAGFPSARRMTNEQALGEALAEIGFHTAYTHEMTLAGQIRLMSRAKLVVGQFGAALWNIPFMPRGGRLIEIATTNYVSNEYLYVSHLCDHRVYRVMIETAESGAYAGENFEFKAPVADIVALARALM